MKFPTNSYGPQKSRRSASCPVRFPPAPWGSADCRTPNVLGLLMFVAGDAKLVRFNTLVNVPSNRKRKRSPIWNCLAKPPSTSIIPGPCKIHKPQFPSLPAPTGVDAKALMLKKCEGVWPAGMGFPTQSGRRDAPVRLAISVLDWSLICVGSLEFGPVGLIV